MVCVIVGGQKFEGATLKDAQAKATQKEKPKKASLSCAHLPKEQIMVFQVEGVICDGGFDKEQGYSRPNDKVVTKRTDDGRALAWEARVDEAIVFKPIKSKKDGVYYAQKSFSRAQMEKASLLVEAKQFYNDGKKVVEEYVELDDKEQGETRGTLVAVKFVALFNENGGQ